MDATQSEYRLHPLSLLFGFSFAELRQFIFPALAGGATALTAGAKWAIVLLIMSIPLFLRSLIRYLTYRYSFVDGEIIIKSGLIFRNERHIPFARIQNINARQNVLQRYFRVVEVTVETGSGGEAEAAMKVLPFTALEQMRERVLAKRENGKQEETTTETKEVELLRITVKELMLFGLLERRGIIIIAGALALLSEVGFFEALIERIIGDEAGLRSAFHTAVKVFTGELPVTAEFVLMAFIGTLSFLILIIVLSMLWSVIRLYGFRLTKSGDDLRTRYGLFTRIEETVPLHRIQLLLVQEGILHRKFGRVSVRIRTAGGGEESKQKNEFFAPVIRRERLPELLTHVLPEIAHQDAAWNPVHPRAARRMMKEWWLILFVIAIPLAIFLHFWAMVPLSLLSGWALLSSHKYAKSLFWSLNDRTVQLKAGWIRRMTTFVPYVKVQTVTVRTSPFDRRAGMATVHADTAGASLTHEVKIPYLASETAREIHERLTREAAKSEYKW